MAARRGRKDDITVIGMMIMEDGSSVPFEELSPEQIITFRERAQQRLSENMSAYYTQHPEEYQRLSSKAD